MPMVHDCRGGTTGMRPAYSESVCILISEINLTAYQQPEVCRDEQLEFLGHFL